MGPRLLRSRLLRASPRLFHSPRFPLLTSTQTPNTAGPGGESAPRWRDSRSRGRLRPGFSHRLCRAEGGDREEAGFVFRGFLLPCSSEPDAWAPFSALPFEGLPQRGVLPSGRSRSQRLLLSEQAGKRSASLGCGESPRLGGVTSFLTPHPSQGGMFPAIVSPEASSRSPSQGHG